MMTRARGVPPSPASDINGIEHARRRRADPRLTAYLVAGFGALVAAMATGQHELVALGAPFLALAASGLIDVRPANVTGTVTLRSGRVIEGDVVEGVVVLERNDESEIEVMLAGWHGITPIEPAPAIGWSLTGQGRVALPFRLRARSWGIHDLGSLWIRVRRPGGLLMWEQKLAAAPKLWVMPTPLRLDRLLKPAEPRTVAGVHVSHYRGHGTDFAELRPYRPGDRVRDLSWTTSARLDTPWVTVHHSERAGTVLLFLDAVFGHERSSTESLARAARAAWAIALVHLKAQDRVGLLAQGRTTAWLPPRGGRRARWLLLEELLAVGGAAGDLERRPRWSRRVSVPADALIIALTTLRSPAFVRDLLHYRRAGHRAVAIVIDTADLLPHPDGHVDAAARRIWFAQRDAERYILARNGVPTALITSTEAVGPAISTLRRRLRTLRPPLARTVQR